MAAYPAATMTGRYRNAIPSGNALASRPRAKPNVQIEPTKSKLVHPTKSKAGRRPVILIVLLVVAFIAVVMFYRPRAPTYAGKDVYYWMFQTSSSDLKENPGLSALGTNAVPSLAAALRVRRTQFDRHSWLQSSFVQKAITNFAPGFGWTHPASTVQRAAAFALLAYGCDAKPALDALHEALVDPRLDTQARRNVINALGELGPPPESLPPFVEAWHQATNDSSLRRDLVLFMSRIATFSPEHSLPIFLTELNSGDEELRNVAIWGANALGPVAHAGVAAAESMIRSTNAYSQFAAAVALGRITNRMPALLPRLRELANGTNGQAAASAALTLFRWGEPVENSITVLTGLLTNKQAKGTAADYLSKIGPAASPAVPTLLAASQEDIGAWVDQYDRARCALAVLQISGPNEIAYQQLRAALKYQSNPWVRYAVARDLGKAGALARPLKESLQENLKDSYRDARHAAAIALEAE